MELLSIGAFASASRLSPKALRLYDELGLLTPARVDPATGYRSYSVTQLDRARLVAWLRRLGMPLAEIRTVCESPAREAATHVRQFWATVECDLAERRDLAAFLVDHLSEQDASGKDPVMTATLHLRCAALCDRGLARETQQDAAFASERVLAVADGFGAGGARASAVAIDALVTATQDDGIGAADLLNLLQEVVTSANQSIAGLGSVTGPRPATGPGSATENGTTLTALVLSGSQLALVHIGDSRAYRWRAGELAQITYDHSVVQAMVDDGRLSPEEAPSHPQRAMLLRALDGSTTHSRADLHLHDAQAGDRYLLCSDGLSAVVPAVDLEHVIGTTPDPQDAVTELVALAHAAGAPDNVSCVVADLAPAV